MVQELGPGLSFSASDEFQSPVFGHGEGVGGADEVNNNFNNGFRPVQVSGVAKNGFSFKDSMETLPPLNLKLKKTPSAMDLLQMQLMAKKGFNGRSHNKICALDLKTVRAKTDNLMNQPAEKLKAGNFRTSILRIGTWERVSMHEGDLVAKCYYAKRKLVWEILDGGLKSKIEIQWSDIVAMKANIQENEPATLELELQTQPLFFRESDPQPRKHTIWQPSGDFTGGQASTFRRHFLKIPPGALDKHYEQLLQADNKLFELSQRPFPSEKSPYFQPSICNYPQFSIDPNPHVLQNHHTHSSLQFHHPSLARNPPVSPSHRILSFGQQMEPSNRSREPGSPLSSEDNSLVNYESESSPASLWQHAIHGAAMKRIDPLIPGQPFVNPDSQVHPTYADQGYEISTLQENNLVAIVRADPGNLRDIESHLLSDAQVVCSNEQMLQVRVESMNSLVDLGWETNLNNSMDIDCVDLAQEYPPNHFLPSIYEDGTAEIDHSLNIQNNACLHPQFFHQNQQMYAPQNDSQYPYELLDQPRPLLEQTAPTSFQHPGGNQIRYSGFENVNNLDEHIRWR